MAVSSNPFAAFLQYTLGAVMDVAEFFGLKLTSDSDRRQEVYMRYKDKVADLLKQGQVNVDKLESMLSNIVTDLYGPTSRAGQIVAKLRDSLTKKLSNARYRQQLATDYSQILLDKAANESFSTGDLIRNEPGTQEKQLNKYYQEVQKNVQEIPKVEQTV